MQTNNRPRPGSAQAKSTNELLLRSDGKKRPSSASRLAPNPSNEKIKDFNPKTLAKSLNGLGRRSAEKSIRSARTTFNGSSTRKASESKMDPPHNKQFEAEKRHLETEHNKTLLENLRRQYEMKEQKEAHAPEMDGQTVVLKTLIRNIDKMKMVTDKADEMAANFIKSITK